MPADPSAWGLPPGLVEIEGRRSRGAKHFRRGDGSYVAVLGGSLHWQDDAGAWQDIDLNWRPDPANLGEHVTDRNDLWTRITRFGVAVWDRKRRIGLRWSSTVTPVVNGNRAVIPKDGLTWTWTTTAQGLKLESSPIAASRGPQTYEWRYLVVDGNRVDGFNLAGTLTAQADGSLVGDGFAVPRAYAIGANGVRYDCGPWQAVAGKQRMVAFAFDDGALPPEAYPYTIDPTTTFNVAVSGDDATTSQSQSVYPPAGGGSWSTTATTGWTERTKSGTTFYIQNLLLRWDTSALPDTATINSATLRVWVTDRVNTNARNVTADWFNWFPADYTDYAQDALTGAITAYSLASPTLNADNDIPLTNASTNVNKTGYTSMRLHVDGGQPTGLNRLEIAMFDHATLAEPRLLVDYTDAGSPPVNATITAPTAIATIQAQAPTVSSTRNASVGAPVATVTTQAGAPTVSASRNASVAAVTATVTVVAPAPTVSATVTAQVAAPTAILTAEAIPPSVYAQRLATILGPPATVTVDAPAPSVGAGRNASIAAPTALLAAQAGAPQVTGGQSATIHAQTAVITVEAPAPTVSTSSGATVTILAPAAEVSVSALAPTVAASRGALVAAPAAALTTQAEAPAVSAQRNATVAAPTAALTVSAGAPTVTVGRQAQVQAPTASVTVEAPAPAPAAQRNATVLAPTATVSIEALAPRVSTIDPITATVVLPLTVRLNQVVELRVTLAQSVPLTVTTAQTVPLTVTTNQTLPLSVTTNQTIQLTVPADVR